MIHNDNCRISCKILLLGDQGKYCSSIGNQSWNWKASRSECLLGVCSSEMHEAWAGIQVLYPHPWQHPCELVSLQPLIFFSKSSFIGSKTLKFLAKIFQYEWKFQLPGNRLIFCLGSLDPVTKEKKKISCATCAPSGFVIKQEEKRNQQTQPLPPCT